MLETYEFFDFIEFSKLDKETSKEKNRNWNAIVYPDSAPEDWIDQLRQLHLPFAVSPLHNQDTNPDGEVKKAHYHIIVCFDGPTTYKNANRCIQGITNGPIVKPCRSIRGSYRYFIHLDNPEKYQYLEKDIQAFNSFEIALTDSDEDAVKRAIFNIILVNRIEEYAELMLVLDYQFGWEYSKVARRNHSFITSVVNSIRNSPGATYKRFLEFVSPDEFNLYALSDDMRYENQVHILEGVVDKYCANNKFMREERNQREK